MEQFGGRVQVEISLIHYINYNTQRLYIIADPNQFAGFLRETRSNSCPCSHTGGSLRNPEKDSSEHPQRSNFIKIQNRSSGSFRKS